MVYLPTFTIKNQLNVPSEPGSYLFVGSKEKPRLLDDLPKKPRFF